MYITIFIVRQERNWFGKHKNEPKQKVESSLEYFHEKWRDLQRFEKLFRINEELS